MPFIFYQLSLIAYQTFPHRSYHHPGDPGFRPGSELAKLIRSSSGIISASIEIRWPAPRQPTTPIRIFLSLSGAIRFEKRNPDSTPRLWLYVRRAGKTRTGARLLSRGRGINVTYSERTLSETLKAFDSLQRRFARQRLARAFPATASLASGIVSSACFERSALMPTM